jgi:competence protein ComEA
MKKKMSRLVATIVALGLAGVFLAGPAVAATKAAPTGKINLNSATVEQLTAVPGVGKTLAARIVEHRQKEGSFKSVSELMNVKGVGEKNLAKIQGYFVVGDASRPAAAK